MIENVGESMTKVSSKRFGSGAVPMSRRLRCVAMDKSRRRLGRARHPTHRPQSQLDASTFDPCLFHIHATFWPWFVFLLNRRHVAVNPVCVSGQIQEVVGQASLQSTTAMTICSTAVRSSVPFSRSRFHVCFRFDNHPSGLDLASS
jgi:hypothetical protein